MAMIFDLGLPAEDLKAIGEFIRNEGEGDVPELEGDSAKVLDAVTSLENPNNLGRTVVGRFIAYQQLPHTVLIPAHFGGYIERPAYQTPAGEEVTHADVLYGDDGKPTAQRGIVEPDFEQPTGAYYIGVPL